MKKKDDITEISDVEKLDLFNKQIELAMNGNVQMLIWLGKQYLNQKDNKPIEFNRPIDRVVMIDDSGEEYIEL